MYRATPKAREDFIRALCDHVPTASRDDALRLLRWGTTYGRLSEAQCNGDWPAENGEGKRYECPQCESGWRVRSALRECPSCRAERIIRETCASLSDTPPFMDRGEGYQYPPKVTPDFQGDPRGHTVRLQIGGAPLDAYDRPALAIPTS